jgi:hypothetical protein
MRWNAINFPLEPQLRNASYFSFSSPTYLIALQRIRNINGVDIQTLTGLAGLEPSTYRLGGDVSVYIYQGF